MTKRRIWMWMAIYMAGETAIFIVLSYLVNGGLRWK